MEIDDPVLHFWTKHREIWKQARIYALKIVYVDVKEDSAWTYTESMMVTNTIAVTMPQTFLKSHERIMENAMDKPVAIAIYL